jgi:hypothetical protein
MRNRRKSLALFALLSLYGVQSQALLTEIVVGGSPTEIHQQNGFPFSTLPIAYGHAGTRYQQVYSSAQFPGAFDIRELVFYAAGRLDAPILPANLEIHFSTTPMGVNEIDFRSFDSNLGADDHLFASLTGGFSLSGSELAIGGNPYLYDPALGNLLLDIRVTGAAAGHSGPFFAALAPGDFAPGATGPFSRWHDFGIGYDNSGLVTGFRTWVPEPGTLALLGLGLVGLGLSRPRRFHAPR